ncbi:hypothetical protein M1K46_08020 [Fictibacillus sp. WQ 8-8]|uniref:hypothetical protein n=1 Tax=Fictibacillus sp. WQ 8-8 TaxID=2938788 RepID=UPI002108DB4B|nr:hypothetical protein [Fictibacillus sp. WQ 8-8]MCQ6265609.1 hypothetical protein [Fictibacillus sp. WQ 8-8]
MFKEEFEMGSTLLVTLSENLKVDSKDVQLAIKDLLKSYSFIIVSTHDKATEVTYEADLMNYENLMMSNSSGGSTSRRSRQMKAQMFD